MQGQRSKIRVIEQALRKTRWISSSNYVLWIEQNAMVVNPGFVFPYKRYSKAGKDIVMYGDMPEVLAGNVKCAILAFPRISFALYTSRKPSLFEPTSPGLCYIQPCAMKVSYPSVFMSNWHSYG